jgi:hypothetical protein
MLEVSVVALVQRVASRIGNNRSLIYRSFPLNKIKIEALNAFTTAFTKLPAIVKNKYMQTMLYGGTNYPGFEHTVYVSGIWATTGTGRTPFASSDHSWIYYLNLLQAAEIYLGRYGNLNDFTPPFTDAPNMFKLATALGKGLGNTAAHEVGWQLSQQVACNKYPVTNMDCSYSTCEGNQYVYESEGSDEWKFKDWNPPIHWQPHNETNIAKRSAE